MKNKRILWGLIFIFAACFIIFSRFGFMQDVSIFKICVGVILAGFTISGIIHRDFTVILFSLAFICIIFSKQLHITNLTPWPVLATALFGSIGLGLLQHPGHKKKYDYSKKSTEFDKVINEADDSEVYCNTQMGSTVKYVNTTNLTSAHISCNFGATKVYFDAAKVQNSNAVINVDVSFGGVELFIPKNWNLQNNIDSFVGGVEIKGIAKSTETGPTVEINGSCKFGGITIYYV